MTTNQIENQLWDHEKRGSGWAIVDKQPNDYVRVVSVSPEKIGTQVFLAWVKMLKPATRFLDPSDPKKGVVDWLIPEKAKPALAELRYGLACGKIKIVSSNIQRQ